MTTYNPNELTKDGPFTAPRKWQHVLKVLIGLAGYAGLLTLFRVGHWPTAVLALAGVGIELGATLREQVAPTDPASRTRPFRQKLSDTLTDTALYSGGAVCELLASGRYIVAALVAAGLFTVYRAFRSGARP